MLQDRCNVVTHTFGVTHRIRATASDGRSAVHRGQDSTACWRNLAWLALAMLLGMSTWFSATAVVPQLEAAWSITGIGSAWLTVSVQVGFVLGALGSGFFSIADRIPPRTLMLWGCAGASVANALLLFTTGLESAIVLRLFTGVCLAGVYPPAMKAMSSWFRVKRGTALGVMVGALTLGSALPHLVNSLGGLDWEAVVTTTSVLTVVGGALARYGVSDGPFPFPRAQFDPAAVWRVVTDQRVMLASVGYFGHMWELYAMWTWFSVFLFDTLSEQNVADPGKWAALGTFLVIGSGAAGCWVGGVLGDRLGRSLATILAMTLSGACAVSIGFTQSAPLWVLVAVALVWGFWVVADSAQFSTAVTELGRQDFIGTALTLQIAMGFVLTIPTIWLIPVIEQWVGWTYAFALLAIGPVVGVVAMARLRTLHATR